MFKKLKEWLFKPALQSSVENYVLSKHPTNTAEVEYWVNQYFYARSWSVL